MPKKAPFQQRRHKLTIYFREWRKEKKLTQQQLAERIGTSKTRVSMKENGDEGWDDSYLAALSEALSVDPASLLMRDPNSRDSPWSLLESLKPESKAKVADYAETLKKAEELDDRAA